jgi:hypothetical protein
MVMVKRKVCSRTPEFERWKINFKLLNDDVTIPTGFVDFSLAVIFKFWNFQTLKCVATVRERDITKKNLRRKKPSKDHGSTTGSNAINSLPLGLLSLAKREESHRRSWHTKR